MAAAEADLAECAEMQQQEVEALEAIYHIEEEGQGQQQQQDGHDGGGGGTRLLVCTKTGEGGAGGDGSQWRLVLDVEVTVPSSGVDIVVVEEEQGGGERERAGTPQQPQQGSSPDSFSTPALQSVKYLPPLRLCVQLGPSYPLHAPPAFTIWAPWLDEAAAAWAGAELGRMWAEVYEGGPVVFSWVEWLEHEILERLLSLGEEEEEEGEGGDSGGARPRLVLRRRPPAMPSPMSSGAVVEGGGGQDAQDEETEELFDDNDDDDGDDGWGPRLLRVLAHALAKERAAFARATHTCYICFEQLGGRAFATLPCGHWWCRGCLGEMARTHVRDGDLAMLACPHPECGAELPPELLKELLPSEAFERWERLLLSKTLERMEDVAYCPRDQTPCIVEGGLGECPTCMYTFCSRCKEAYHGGAAECFTGEARLRQVEAEIERIMARGGRLTATQNEKLEKLRRAAEESLSRRAVEKGSRACPACAMPVEKVEGCNKMKCRCGTLWCWACGEDISEASYGHFMEGASNCGLWEREALLAWQRQMAAHMHVEGGRGGIVQGEMVRLVNWGGWGAPEDDGGAWRRQGRGRGRGRQQQGDDDGIRIVRCGRCGGQHVKLDGNNHLRCHACTAQFCALCGAAGFRKASDHFGPGGCKQHS